MRRLIKFLHTIGAIGMMGAMACFLVLLTILPEPSAAPEYAQIRLAMAAISTWIFLPSLVIALISGLLAIAVTRAHHDVGWVRGGSRRLAANGASSAWCSSCRPQMSLLGCGDLAFAGSRLSRVFMPRNSLYSPADDMVRPLCLVKAQQLFALTPRIYA